MSESRPTTSQWRRRDFLVGAGAGVATAGAASAAWHGPPHRYPEGVNPSYSQSGEDVIVANLFEDLKVDRPTYLDVGAFLPIFANNTYLFYGRGGRGVLVEPNVALIPELRARRPRDTVRNVGVGLDATDAADYFCLSLAQWNTFDRAEAERRVAGTGGQVKIERVVRMPLVPINRLLADHFPDGGPDLLSIDIESLDLAVLRTLDFARFRPKVICTETLVALTLRMDPATTEFLGAHGYEPRGMTLANTIYVDRKLLLG